MQRSTLVTIGLIAVVLLAGCGNAPTTGAEPADDDRKIHVAGAGSADAEPNRAVIDLGVVARADTAAAARQRLAANVSRMREALSAAGVTDSQIRTQRYDLRRDVRYRRDGGPEPAGYEAEHAFEITLEDTDRVGTVIDTAVRNGATGIDHVEFTLSTDRRRALEADARQAAMADARGKAEELAGAANLTVTGVEVIRTGGDSAPRPARAMATPTPTAAADVGADLESGPVTVTAQVRVVYRVAETTPTSAAT